MSISECIQTTKLIASPGKGILAADESDSTIKKRFDSINTESTKENRRVYRTMLFSTPNLSNFICGIILFEETLFQKMDNGMTIPEFLLQNNILPGIKVDKGLIDLAASDNEKVTQGLDFLSDRIKHYKEAGAKFAKWRCVYNIGTHKPSDQAIHSNSECLARYAAICQQHGIAPIVEPEILINGHHNIEECAQASEKVFSDVFSALERHHVCLEGIILKPSMVIAGDECTTQAPPEHVAKYTLKILKRTIPSAVPTINFLSGGQTPEQATLHLDLMNKLEDTPWNLSFSYGRALQEPALNAWAGNSKNIRSAQNALYKRAQLNGLAAKGEYSQDLETETVTY